MIRQAPVQPVYITFALISLIILAGCNFNASREKCSENEKIYETVTIPAIDLNYDSSRQVLVDREEGQYLGHVTTVLLEDGKTGNVCCIACRPLTVCHVPSGFN